MASSSSALSAYAFYTPSTPSTAPQSLGWWAPTPKVYGPYAVSLPPLPDLLVEAGYTWADIGAAREWLNTNATVINGVRQNEPCFVEPKQPTKSEFEIKLNLVMNGWLAGGLIPTNRYQNDPVGTIKQNLERYEFMSNMPTPRERWLIENGGIITSPSPFVLYDP